jgi:hypothetical protein
MISCSDPSRNRCDQCQLAARGCQHWTSRLHRSESLIARGNYQIFYLGDHDWPTSLSIKTFCYYAPFCVLFPPFHFTFTFFRIFPLRFYFFNFLFLLHFLPFLLPFPFSFPTSLTFSPFHTFLPNGTGRYFLYTVLVDIEYYRSRTEDYVTIVWYTTYSAISGCLSDGHWLAQSCQYWIGTACRLATSKPPLHFS